MCSNHEHSISSSVNGTLTCVSKERLAQGASEAGRVQDTVGQSWLISTIFYQRVRRAFLLNGDL